MSNTPPSLDPLHIKQCLKIIAEDLILSGFHPESETTWIPVRLRVLREDCEILWGDPSFDTDHRGEWSYSDIAIRGNEILSCLTEITAELISNIGV